MAALLGSTALAAPPPSGAALLAAWKRPGVQVVLLTPERLAAFGAGYDPAELGVRHDLVVELTTERAPFCPPVPPFDLWTKVGIFPYAPYLHGCGGPTELTSITADGDHVDLVGAIPVPGADGAEVRLRITPLGGGRHTASWRLEAAAAAPWSAPITLVEGGESTLGRLVRHRKEAGLAALRAAGVDVDAGRAIVNGAAVAFVPASCMLGQLGCDPDDLAVVCTSAGRSLLWAHGALSVVGPASGWNACLRGPLPGIAVSAPSP